MNAKHGKLILGFVGALLLGAAGPASAAGVSGVFGLGYDIGGDDLVKVYYSSGSSSKIKANEGLYFYGGALIPNTAAGNWETQLTIGYKYGTTDQAANGAVTWTAIPLEAIEFFNQDQFRFGAGLTFHVNPELSGSGVLSGLNVSFDNAVGVVVVVDWRASPNLAFGLRYTNIDYSAGGGSVSGNGLGLTMSIMGR